MTRYPGHLARVGWKATVKIPFMPCFTRSKHYNVGSSLNHGRNSATILVRLLPELHVLNSKRSANFIADLNECIKLLKGYAIYQSPYGDNRV